MNMSCYSFKLQVTPESNDVMVEPWRPTATTLLFHRFDFRVIRQGPVSTGGQRDLGKAMSGFTPLLLYCYAMVVERIWNHALVMK